jgi:hypothetical protein
MLVRRGRAVENFLMGSLIEEWAAKDRHTRANFLPRVISGAVRGEPGRPSGPLLFT